MAPLGCLLPFLAPAWGPGDGASELHVEVETRAGATWTGRLAGLREGSLQLEVDGSSQSVALDELLLMNLRGAAPAAAVPVPASGAASLPAPSDVLFIARADAGTGDRLVGRLLGGDEFGVRFALDADTPVTIPFDRIERVLPRADLPIDRLALLEGGGKDDRVWQRRADGGFDNLTGVVARVGATELVFEGALGALTFALDEVVAVVLAPAGKAPPEPKGRPVVVRLSGGSRLVGGLLEIGAEKIVLATRFADRLELPLSVLTSLVVRGDDVVLLADLVPTQVDERPTLGAPADFLFPWRADLSVTGRLLSVGGVPRATGLGVHANADLAFALPAGASRLRVTAGLCDEVAELAAQGSVSFEILVDGVSRASSGVLREGQAPVVLRVDGLAGHERLELRLRDGGDDDAGDRAAWVDGVILLGDA